MLVRTIEPVEAVDCRLQDRDSHCCCLSCEDVAGQVRLWEGKGKPKRCPVICAEVSDKVTQTQCSLFEDHSQGPPQASEDLEPPKQIRVNSLHGSQQVLTDLVMGLEEHFRDKKLQELPIRGPQVSGQNSVIRRSIFEDVLAGQGASQLILASKDIILARRVTAGKGARQWLGYMSDDTLQHLSHTLENSHAAQ